MQSKRLAFSTFSKSARLPSYPQGLQSRWIYISSPLNAGRVLTCPTPVSTLPLSNPRSRRPSVPSCHSHTHPPHTASCHLQTYLARTPGASSCRSRAYPICIRGAPSPPFHPQSRCSWRHHPLRHPSRCRSCEPCTHPSRSLSTPDIVPLADRHRRSHPPKCYRPKKNHPK